VVTAIDDRLQARLIEWRKQADKLHEVEQEYLQLEASEKPLFAHLYLQADGKTVIERESIAYDSNDWVKFKDGLATSKAVVNHERRLLEIKQKAFDAEYLALKTEASYIKRGSES
jgi:hypothetical protein